MRYNVYAIGGHGNGSVQKLEGWDGVDSLSLDLSIFSPNTVIEIEPDYEKEATEEDV